MIVIVIVIFILQQHENIEVVTKFVFLGALITTDGLCEKKCEQE